MIRKLVSFAMLALAATDAGVPMPVQQPQKEISMSDSQFWSIIEASDPSADHDQQIGNLHRQLDLLSTEDVAAFQAQFDRKIADAYSWDLWGAAFVIHGGAGDDGFEYFRCWLISRGQATYEAALADPDALARLIPDTAHEPLELEGLAYVGFGIWQQRTGLGPRDFPNAAAGASEPKGKPFEEDEAELAARYPKLWARFGGHPLG